MNFSLDNLKVLAEVAKHFFDYVLIFVECLQDALKSEAFTLNFDSISVLLH